MNSPASPYTGVAVQRWPSEIPLLVISAVLSAGIWLLLTITVIGLAYALMIGAFFFVAHAMFVAYIKGNAVKVGQEQFPEIDAAVTRLAQRIGMRQPPVAYVMESGGALNALATKFMASNMIVLYSDLIDACGDDEGARDMIIAHELGHIHAGHLRWHWFLLPSTIVPFLGSALSRAREYTCDRYGLHGCADREAALTGLTILAAGPKLGRQVNRRAFVAQRSDLNTGWMTIGKWLATHPPLAARVAALDPALEAERYFFQAGIVRAVAIVGGIPMLFLALAAGAVFFLGSMLPAGLLEAATAGSSPEMMEFGNNESAMTEQANHDLLELAKVANQEQRTKGLFPEDFEALIALCEAPCDPDATDPFDGQDYGYLNEETHFVLFSSGPDGRPRTADDIVFDSRVGQVSRGWRE